MEFITHSLSKSLHKLSPFAPYRLLYLSATLFPLHLCVFETMPSSPPTLVLLFRFFSISSASSPFCPCSLNFLIVSSSFHFSCVSPFPPSVAVAPHLASTRWRVLLCELPDECSSFTVVVFFACPRNEFGHLIHTRNALHPPQRANPSKKQ